MKKTYKFKISTPNKKSFVIIENILTKMGCPFSICFLPTKKRRFVFLKSPHVNSKSKEHFQFIQTQRLYTISFLSLTDLNFFLSSVPNDLNISLKNFT